jgi:Lhr-like helicase
MAADNPRTQNQFDEFESIATERVDTTEFSSVTARPCKRKRQLVDNESKGGDTELQGRDKFHMQTFLVIVDELQPALHTRINTYSEVRKLKSSPV